MVSLKNLIRDNVPAWRAADDIVMTAGRDGRILPTHIVQLIGTLPDDNQQCTSIRIDEMYEIRNDASP
eukprot:8095581-Pyramimonas_sp.AAC.1